MSFVIKMVEKNEIRSRSSNISGWLLISTDRFSYLEPSKPFSFSDFSHSRVSWFRTWANNRSNEFVMMSFCGKNLSIHNTKSCFVVFTQALHSLMYWIWPDLILTITASLNVLIFQQNFASSGIFKTPYLVSCLTQFVTFCRCLNLWPTYLTGTIKN